MSIVRALLSVLLFCCFTPVQPALAANSATRDLTFYVVSDTHYGLGGEEGAKTIPKLVDLMNELPGKAFPDSIGGTVSRPRGVLHCGDITNDGKPEQLEPFLSDYGLTGKEGRLKWPVFEAYGNHDGGPKSAVRKAIRERNRLRPGLTAVSTNHLHYYWVWDRIHFINLGIAPGSTNNPYDPEYSMEFLDEILEKHVKAGEPLILMHHFGFDKGHSMNWWSDERRAQYLSLIKEHNVLGIIHGHAHQPMIYTWEGLDIYHPPHFRQQDPKNQGPVTHGVFVFRITDTELTVAEHKLDGTWGMTAKKEIRAPVAAALAN